MKAVAEEDDDIPEDSGSDSDEDESSRTVDIGQ